MKRILYICFCALLFLFCADKSFSQWKVRTLPNQKQMPVGNVHQTIQDRNGYIWYATDGGGLCRDNGYQIDVIREGLPSLQISCITEDCSGNIWVGTLSGLCILDYKDRMKIRRIELKHFKSCTIDAILSTEDGDVWVASRNVLGCFDTNGSCSKIYYAPNRSDKSRYINSFYEDSNGNIWLLESRGGILVYDRTKDTFLRMTWSSGEPVEMIEDTLHNCFWIGTWNNGVIRYGTNEYEATPDFNTLDLCLSADGKTLFTTDMSMLRQWNILPDGTLCEDTSIQSQLPSGSHILDKMNLDSEGNIWVASYMPHTFIISSAYDYRAEPVLTELNDMFLSHTGIRVLPHNIIVENNDIWIWQGRVGLLNYNPKYGVQNCEGIGAPYHLSRMEKCIDKSGLWIADGHYIKRVWREGIVIHNDKVLGIPGNEKIYSIYDSGDGNLWIGTERSIYRYCSEDSILSHVSDMDSAVLFLALDAEGRPYGLTLNMLSSYTALCRGNEGTLWWGDSNGYIYRQMSGDTLPQRMYCAAAGETINRICCDSAGHIWALTDQTISEYNPSTSARRTISATDERLGVDFFRSICVADIGVYIGAAGNILRMSSSSALDSSSNSAVPVVSTIICDSVMQVPKDSDIKIAYSTKVVEVRMTVLDILHAENIRYAYRIRELGNDWEQLPIGQNTLRLLLPSAGKYTLEAMATDRNGVWSHPVRLLTVHKMPAWWQSDYAYATYTLITVLLLWMTLRWIIIRQKRLNLQKMERELTEMKFRFFTNISHELRTPLSLIITPLERMISKGGNDALRPILRQAEYLLEMINRLLDFRKFETGNAQFTPSVGNLSDFIRMEADAVIPLAEKKHIVIDVNTPVKDLFYSFDSNKMHHILSNLIGNAIKYNRDGGNVCISLSVNENSYLSITISDTGIGIPEYDIKHIFDRFYQGHNHSHDCGTGIGLDMTKEFVTLHGGELTVESTEGKGSTFVITLPFRSYCSSEECCYDSSSQSSVRLLLAEDNNDLRTFLSEELAAEGYIVVQATDGFEALSLIKENPDISIVISDVMMSRIDGVELCRNIKSDIKTSHIPIILLTACTTDENKLEGYGAGADFYITKPFNMEILLNRISYLLHQSENRRKIFLQSVELKSEKLAENNLDRQFIERAVALVESNISNTNYSVEMFANDMNTDRSNLYRKLQTLTGQKPTEFIRTIRLKYSARLLKGGSHSISEVADICGFSTPSYFAHCFKNLFGKTPGEYQKSES